MRRNKRIIIFLAQLIVITVFLRCSQERKTEILVLGTIHQFHYVAEGYSTTILKALLEKLQPDVVCIETRPKDFERDDYSKSPPEVGQVIVPWAKKNGVEIIPIDWWEEGMREATMAYYDSLKNTETGQELEEKEKRLLGDIQNPVSTPEKINYLTVNSDSIQNILRKEHQVSAEVYGEGVPTMFWEERNQKILNRILEVVDTHHGKRIVVAIGAEHKYWLDNELRKIEQVKFLSVPRIDISSLQLTREVVLNRLFTKLESRQANTNPDGVDLTGVKQDIDFLLKKNPNDAVAWYYLGMFYYVGKDYQKSLNNFEKAAQDKAATLYPFPIKLYSFATVRIAMMFDLLNQRERAIEIYQQILDDPQAFKNARRLAERGLKQPFQRPSKGTDGN